MALSESVPVFFPTASISMNSSSLSVCVSPQFMEQLVFLQPKPEIFIPHILYCLEVYPGIMLVMVAEHGNLQNLANLICHTLTHLDTSGILNAASKPTGSSQGTYDILDDSIKYV